MRACCPRSWPHARRHLVSFTVHTQYQLRTILPRCRPSSCLCSCILHSPAALCAISNQSKAARPPPTPRAADNLSPRLPFAPAPHPTLRTRASRRWCGPRRAYCSSTWACTATRCGARTAAAARMRPRQGAGGIPKTHGLVGTARGAGVAQSEQDVGRPGLQGAAPLRQPTAKCALGLQAHARVQAPQTTHAHMCGPKRTHLRMLVRACARARTHAHTHAHTHTHSHTRARARARAHARTPTHAHTDTRHRLPTRPQACTHCHVESSPKRTEMMDAATADRCLELLASAPGVHTLDLTGGAPELTPQFRLARPAHVRGGPGIRCACRALA